MRVLSFCIAIMILVMSCIPCSDASRAAMEPLRIAQQTDPGAHEHARGDEHQDLCSPFCQCTCCALTYALPVLPDLSLELLPAISGRLNAAYTRQHLQSIALPVWQPPQLG